MQSCNEIFADLVQIAFVPFQRFTDTSNQYYSTAAYSPRNLRHQCNGKITLFIDKRIFDIPTRECQYWGNFIFIKLIGNNYISLLIKRGGTITKMLCIYAECVAVEI